MYSTTSRLSGGKSKDQRSSPTVSGIDDQQRAEDQAGDVEAAADQRGDQQRSAADTAASIQNSAGNTINPPLITP